MNERAKGCVLITGASRGIGAAIALSLARDGFDLVLWARNEMDLAAVAAECRLSGGSVRFAPVDVGRPSSVDGAGKASLQGIEKLHGCVVNAGIGIWGRLTDFPPEDWRSVMSTNLDGAFFTLQLAMPLLTGPLPQILVIGSDSEAVGLNGRTAYCASKWGLHGLAEALRRETRSTGVRLTHLSLSRVDSYFRGKMPGDRPASLTTDDIGSIVSWIFSAPPQVEIREMAVSSIQSPFGVYPEFFEGAIDDR